jgi:hypothetical protein
MNKILVVTSLLLIAGFAMVIETTTAMAMSKEKAIAECRTMYQNMHRYAAPDAFKACVADKMRQN